MKRGFLFTHDRPLAELSETQRLFLQWNAERLGISLRESQERYSRSYTVIYGGHHGPGYRLFNDISYKTYQVFFNDSGNELFHAYQHHAPMHFLRMLAYPEPIWNEEHIIVQTLTRQKHVDILDYGCGLAQRSRSLAMYLKQQEIGITLCLADIPTIRKDFLLWACQKAQIETTFLDCTTDGPTPNIPSCDICFANEFFEHVHNPLQYLAAFHGVLKPNGILEANISDHNVEFMHISPSLKDIRDRIHVLSYKDYCRTNSIRNLKIMDRVEFVH